MTFRQKFLYSSLHERLPVYFLKFWPNCLIVFCQILYGFAGLTYATFIWFLSVRMLQSSVFINICLLGFDLPNRDSPLKNIAIQLATRHDAYPKSDYPYVPVELIFWCFHIRTSYLLPYVTCLLWSTQYTINTLSPIL